MAGGESLAWKIDHVGIALDDALPVFEWCRDGLGLPVAWEFGTHGTVRSGGLCLGNLNLELFDAASLGSRSTGLRLIALEPATGVAELVTALEERNVWHLGPLVTPGTTGFTNVMLEPLVVDMTFFCSYHDARRRDDGARRAALDAVRGGRLGLHGVTEIRAAIDVEKMSKVVGPPRADAWAFTAGPSLVADRTVTAGCAEMVWRVDDATVHLPEPLRGVRLLTAP